MRARGFARGPRSASANCGSGHGRSATRAVFARRTVASDAERNSDPIRARVLTSNRFYELLERMILLSKFSGRHKPTPLK
jgi:hypothetical protein